MITFITFTLAFLATLISGLIITVDAIETKKYSHAYISFTLTIAALAFILQTSFGGI